MGPFQKIPVFALDSPVRFLSSRVDILFVCPCGHGPDLHVSLATGASVRCGHCGRSYAVAYHEDDTTVCHYYLCAAGDDQDVIDGIDQRTVVGWQILCPQHSQRRLLWLSNTDPKGTRCECGRFYRLRTYVLQGGLLVMAEMEERI